MLSSAEFNELIARLKQKPEYSFLKSMGKKKIEDDYRVVGKPVGWRIKGKDNYKVPSKRFRAENPDLVYYENRINRSDVRRPNRLEKGGMMENQNLLKEDDYVWNAVGKKLVVNKVTKDEYYLSGFMQRGDSPFSKSKVNSYIKSGEWTLKPKMARGGYVSKGEMVWKKITDSQKMDFLYKNFTPEITPRTQEILRGKSWNFLPKNVKIKFESKYANVEDYATGGNMDSLMTKDIKQKWNDYTEGDSRGNFASYDSILKEMESANFYGRAFRPKTGSATIYNTLNLLKKLGVIYEVTDMRKPISQRGYYLKNNQMATGGSLKKKDVKHPKAFKIDLDVESRMGNNEHFEVGKMRGYGDALVSRSALQHNAPENYKYSVKATNKYAKGGGVKKKDKIQPASTPNANVNPMDSYNVELVESQGKEDKGNYYMFPKPADKNSKGVLFKKGGMTKKYYIFICNRIKELSLCHKL
jgi:hypothetical protein